MFSRKTFAYFEEAEKNRRNRKWFEKNRSFYEEEVKRPFTELLKSVRDETEAYFPGVSFHPARISLPMYRDENIPEDGTIVKPFSWAFLSEKKTSLFEWNPGINIYFGEELTLGLGLYHPSSRQMGLLRESILKNPAEFRSVLRARKFQTTWGELAGEKFTKLPRGVDPVTKGSEFLWHKQFIVTRNLTRKEVMSADFSHIISKDLIAGADFLQWIRDTVGVYERVAA